MFCIITGFGRSGTSVLARFAQLNKYDLRGGWVDATDAGAEDPLARQINAAIQADIEGRTTEDCFPLDLCQRLIKGMAVDGAKCPHFGTHEGRIIEFWHKVRQDLNVIYTIREPKHCLQSRMRIAELQHTENWWGPRGDDVNQFYKDLFGCIQTMERLKIEYSILSFPQFLNEYHIVEAVMSKHGLAPKEGGHEIWQKLVNPLKVHIK